MGGLKRGSAALRTASAPVSRSRPTSAARSPASTCAAEKRSSPSPSTTAAGRAGSTSANVMRSKKSRRLATAATAAPTAPVPTTRTFIRSAIQPQRAGGFPTGPAETPWRPAMKLSYLVKGPPGHPLHPPLTDITIGTYTFATVAAILDVANLVQRNAAYAWWIALVVGLCSTALTATTGLVDWLGIEWGSELWKTATAHLSAMLAATGA